MVPVIKHAWLTALRSNEYAEGRYALYDGQGRSCALGVLCDIYSKAQGVPWQFDSKLQMYYLHTHTTHNGSVVPDCGFPGTAVLTWAQLPVNLAEKVAGMSQRGETFEAIVNWIKKTL